MAFPVAFSADGEPSVAIKIVLMAAPFLVVAERLAPRARRGIRETPHLSCGVFPTWIGVETAPPVTVYSRYS
jgi:hypothetical protein